MNEIEDHYVYVLIHVEENKVFYVGRGKAYKGRYDRYRAHLSMARRGCGHYVHRKMRKLLDAHQHIKFEPRVTGATREQSIEAEKKLIAAYGLDNLTNILSEEPTRSFLERKKSEPDGRSYRLRTQNELDGLSRAREKIKKPVWVKDMVTGKVTRYSSLKEASRSLGRDPTGLRYLARLNGKHSRCVPFTVSFNPLEDGVTDIDNAKRIKGWRELDDLISGN